MARRREERAGGGQRDVRAALERYQLHGIRETGEELGRGSYAAVIEVHYKGMRCAAKKIYDILREGDRLVERFEEECRLLGTLRHPHIVQFLGIYFDPSTDLPVLVMEFLPATLTQCVDRYGRLPAEICYAILRDVALGLRYLHEQRPRLIHRDLSANNVLLTGDMAAKISDLGVAKILQINPAEMSRMTQTPGTQSYMAPEALRPNPTYDIEVDVFSFGVMMVHVLSGQWPLPSEATRVDPHNPAAVIGVSEVERRAEYLDVIGRPSDEEEGHPLVALIERCLSNSPNLRPNASELVERMSDASAQRPLTFSNRVDMMQRIESVQREKDTLQTRVSELEGQVERGQTAQREQIEQSQRQEAALTVEVEQLKLQVGSLESEKTHISTTAAVREDLLHNELKKKEEMLQESLATKERQLQTQQREHQERLEARERQLQAEVNGKDSLSNSPNLRPNASELVERMSYASAQRPLTFSNRMDMMQRIDSIQREKETLQTEKETLQREKETLQRENETLQREKEALQTRVSELEGQVEQGQETTETLYTQQRTGASDTWEGHPLLAAFNNRVNMMLRIDSFQTEKETLQREKETLQTQIAELEGQVEQGQETTETLYTQQQRTGASDTWVHAFSPNTSLVWRECASIPVEMMVADTTVINGMVYMGGWGADDDSHMYLVSKYDPVKDEWTTLPPAPVIGFGVGQLNGKLVIVGGWKEGATRDVQVFEEDTQQWVQSIPPMPRELGFSIVVSHGSSLVVCGTPDRTSSSSVLVYNSQSSQWHLAAALPLTFQSVYQSIYSSAVVVNDTYYIAVGGEGVIVQDKFPSSPAVFSLPLSTLLDPNAPQDPSIWQRMPDTPCHMSHLAATGGCLLAVGGLWNGCDAKDSETIAPTLSTAVHAYCPATSSWVKIGDLPDLRYGPAITTMSSGEVFIAGGTNKKVFRGIIK